MFLSPKKFPKIFKSSKMHFGSLINSINSSILLLPILFLLKFIDFNLYDNSLLSFNDLNNFDVPKELRRFPDNSKLFK